MSAYDIIIVGGGIAGMTAALALAKKTELQIALIDANEIKSSWNESQASLRVSAISLTSQRIFRRLGVWEALQKHRVSPYQKMMVWDAKGNGKINFDCRSLQETALGFIIEDDLIKKVLLEKLLTQKNIHLIAPLKILALQKQSDYLELLTAQTTLQAPLIIGADGGNSWIREQAGIAFNSWDYQHEAIIATVQTTLPHAQTARQRFLTSGPLAFLPLTDEYTSSIVWSTKPDHAKELMTLADGDFQAELTQAFAAAAGEITAVSRRQSFSLQMRHVKNYVQQGIALIGDAAHTIHPLAGQGVNLGLLDAVSLADVIEEAVNKQRNFASLATLRRYERWRKGDNMAMLAFVEAIKQVFGSENKQVNQLRNAGLNLTNQLDFVKNWFASYAAGQRGDLPALARLLV